MLGDIFLCVLLLCALVFIAIILSNIYNYINAGSVYAESTYAGSADKIKDLDKHPRSKSEAILIDILESILGKQFPTVNPKWLVWRGTSLELDGYNEELKLAIEFSGPLHTKWYPEKEPYVKYFERIVRDIVKRKLCKQRGVKLIVVDMSLPRVHWRDYLLSRLLDFGIIDTMNGRYIDKQTARPYRNKQLEKELGLSAEIKVANRL